MMDTCAGASIFQGNFDRSATDDSTVVPVRLSSATDDPVHGDAGKNSCFGLRDGRKFPVRYNEADVSFPIVSTGEASQQGNWFVFGPGCQTILPGSSGDFSGHVCKTQTRQSWRNTEECTGCHARRRNTRTEHRCAQIPEWGVYWLPCSATEHTDGTPLCPNPRVARSAVEAPPISVPDPDATPMQLEEGEATRRPKRRELPANVSKKEFDAHQLTHLPFRSWCDHCVRGKGVDDAHTPRIDPHRGEAFFLATATDPPHAMAVLNCLDFQSGAVFSAMVLRGGDQYALAVALEAIKFTGRTRLIIMSDQENAVENLVDMIRDIRTHQTAMINTPKGSSASAGGFVRANYEVEKQFRTLKSRYEENYGESVGLDHKMLPFLVRHCAWLIMHYQVKSDGQTPYERLRGRPYQGQVAEFAEVVHFRAPGKAADMPKLDDRWNLGLWLGKSLASEEHYVDNFGRSSTEMNGEPWNPTAHHQDKTSASSWSVHHSGTSFLARNNKRLCGMLRACKGAFARMQGTIPEHRGQ